MLYLEFVSLIFYVLATLIVQTAMEHSAQVILYAILMSERCNELAYVKFVILGNLILSVC